MPLDQSIAAKIEGYQRELKNEREENRRRFPVAAAAKQAIERVFGKCRVMSAENYETGERIGETMDAHAWIAWPDFGKYGDPRQTVSDVGALSKSREKRRG